jgi:hypothetical protein
VYFFAQITDEKLAWDAKSKIDSLANVTHKPSGGDIEVHMITVPSVVKALIIIIIIIIIKA